MVDISQARFLPPLHRRCLACRVERLSLQPRAYLFHGFLSNDEADHIIKAGCQGLFAVAFS